MVKHRVLLWLLLFLSLPFVANAKTTVYLLTTYPSDREVYTVWGHTALLVTTDSTSVVYNYGVFEFSDDFIYKFVSGQTDYCLDTDSPQTVANELVWKNSYAYLHELDLTEAEAERVHAALLLNAKPENKVYRYKFFSDNCATRPRELLERCIGEVKYMPIGNTESYRDKVHVLCASMPWLRVGIDLCLGSGADEVIPDSMVTFLPVELMKQVESATVSDSSGATRPLVKSKLEMWHPQPKKFVAGDFPISPVKMGVLLLIFALLSLVFAWRNICVAYVRAFGAFLFFAFGLTGMLIFFLTFFSTHECTFPNFNLMWTNPLHLVVAGVLAVGARNRFAKAVLSVDLLLCVGYMLLIAMLPQSTCVEFILCSLSLIISCLSYLVVYKKSFFAKFDKKTLQDKQRIK